ncbi:Kelch repeat-containing protein [Gayadomonas joobiniege]|uniref:Kelch repeat-containing protein n=1 Tax=Gayadomonas joobiniege TaxID=1234606 RepID=UPI000376025F|nr:kelch repeat-containing protein [Gayadomonas joobiniege]
MKLSLTLSVLILTFITGCQQQPPALTLNIANQWQTVETKNTPVQRHEATFLEYKGKFYAVGGRGVRPVSIYDPKTNQWQKGAKPPFQIHHFQAVVYQNKIVIAGAMTGNYPSETPVENIIYYYPDSDHWEIGPAIPKDRLRGGAGVVLQGDNLYIAAGIQNGHIDGWVKWLDVYNLKTGQWQQLPDAPRARDHYQAAIIDDKIYLAGGRRTSQITKQVFSLVVLPVDVYDIKTQQWSTLPKAQNIPTGRAGTSSLVVDKHLLVLGGESAKPGKAHNEVEALDTKTQRWKSLPPMVEGRHGTGAILYDNAIWTCCGSGNRGGRPELKTTEKLNLN